MDLVADILAGKEISGILLDNYRVVRMEVDYERNIIVSRKQS